MSCLILMTARTCWLPKNAQTGKLPKIKGFMPECAIIYKKFRMKGMAKSCAGDRLVLGGVNDRCAYLSVHPFG